MRSRTTSALAFGPTGNEQGGMCFYYFSTGKQFTGRNWTTLPIPTAIITQVHRLVRKTKGTNGLLYEYRDQRTVEDNHADNIITTGVDNIANQGNNEYDDEYSDDDDEDFIPPLLKRDYESDSDSDSDFDYEDSEDEEEEDDGEEDDDGRPDDYEAYLDRDEEYEPGGDDMPPLVRRDDSSGSGDENSSDDEDSDNEDSDKDDMYH